MKYDITHRSKERERERESESETERDREGGSKGSCELYISYVTTITPQ